MSNTAEIYETDDGYEVSAQNTDGVIFVNSFVVEDDAFEHIVGHVQEKGRTAYDAAEGYEFIIEGENRVGARIGYLHCVEETQIEEYTIPYKQKHTFDEMVEELGVPGEEEAYDAINFLPPLSLEVEYDRTEGEASIMAVKIGGKTYEIEEQS